MKKEITTYLILDESGAIHLKNDRYFVIAGYVTTQLHKIRSVHKKLEKQIKDENNINMSRELKASFLRPKNKARFINELCATNALVPVSIIVDKEVLRKRNIEENVAYNMLVKNLLKFLLTYKSDLFPTKNITLLLDNRSIKIKYQNELETYLDWEIGEIFARDFKVEYKNSAKAREIQVADYLANVIYGRYNYIDTEKTSSLIPYFSSIIISKFPYKEFEEPVLKKEQQTKELIEI